MNQSLIDKYAGRKKKDEEKGKTPYKAFSCDQAKSRQIHMDIRDRSGNGFLISYAHITRVKYTSHQLLSIYCVDCIFTLEGRNLEKMRSFLQDANIRYIQEFNKNSFLEPENEEAVIEKIVMTETGSGEKGVKKKGLSQIIKEYPF